MDSERREEGPPRLGRALRRVMMVAGGVLALASSALAGPVCTPYTQATFPPGMVWWRIDPEGGRQDIKGFPEATTAYLVTAVRPDGVLVQNKEARYPRLLSWKVLTRSQISLDGRRTWRAACGP